MRKRKNMLFTRFQSGAEITIISKKSHNKASGKLRLHFSLLSGENIKIPLIRDYAT